MQARYNELSGQLARLNRRPAGRTGPPNPGFEPAARAVVQLTGARTAAAAPGGWQVVGTARRTRSRSTRRSRTPGAAACG